MQIKKISFIEAGSPNVHVFSKRLMPRLGAVLLSTILKEKGYEVRTFLEDFSEPDWSYIQDSDVVCISTITSTSKRAYNIAKKLKPAGMPVIIGGPHASFLPEEALQYADFVVRGEGEHALPELLMYLEKGDPNISSIAGLSYRTTKGELKHNPPRGLLHDLDALPQPDFSLIHEWKSSGFYPVSTSRGCPFNCRFCSVIQMFGRKYRFKSPEAALKEFRHAAAASSKVFIVDDNFTANKNRAREILRGMIAEKIKLEWIAQSRIDIADDSDLLRLMADAGCDTVCIGFESINPNTLKAYNKKQNIQDIEKCIATVKDHGMHIHGMFVFGADSDDLDTLRRTADFAIKHHLETIQFSMLTPLPGTPFFEEIENSGRFLHKDWSKYDGHHAVFRPKQMSAKELQIDTLKAMGRFYSWKYILRHLMRLELQYAALGIFGKKAIHKALNEVSSYIDSFEVKMVRT